MISRPERGHCPYFTTVPLAYCSGRWISVGDPTYAITPKLRLVCRMPPTMAAVDAPYDHLPTEVRARYYTQHLSVFHI